MAKIIFALKDNKIVDIDSVENGLACGCKCIACGEDLIARNNGVVREHHFAHHGCEDTSACYNKSIVSVMDEGFNRSKRILLPSLSITSGDKHKEVVKNGKLFEYCDVEVLKRKKVERGGYYTLLLLTDKNGNKLEVVVSCGVKNNSEYTNGKMENSRIEFVLDTVEIFNIKDLNKILLEGLLDSKWIYNRKAEEFKRECLVKNKISTDVIDLIGDRLVRERKFYKKSNGAKYNAFKRIESSGGSKVIDEFRIKFQEEGIQNNVSQGICPYCKNNLKILGGTELEVLRCNICAFKAEVDRRNNIIKFSKRYGDKSIVVLPIPQMFLEENRK